MAGRREAPKPALGLDPRDPAIHELEAARRSHLALHLQVADPRSPGHYAAREDSRVTKTVADAVSAFGASAKSKLSNVAVSGAPEDQLRGPLEALARDLAEIGGLPAGTVHLVGETSLAELKTRPDFAVTVHNALVGFIEVKAPGKGADPRKFTDPHDKDQWDKLKSLPNLIYTDGNAFSLWRDGKLVGSIVHLEGDIETAGAKLNAPPSLLALVSGLPELAANTAEERQAARGGQRPPLPFAAR